MDNHLSDSTPGHLDLHLDDDQPEGEPAVPSTGILADEAGSTTAEFAIVTLAAVAFAGLLVSILSSGDVRGMLMSLIRQALSF
ncbi:DUF4244 domain-containing protein [Paeniglutamicibacter gangotriensis]|uniref:DUF4244 domain-containing protein n=1 Tax=Paeniglutamicibacter gangotriensis Lz1y TaxID=1276920 RepID=M7MV22_9MICC|nr:DUF4244 domain-containing protein [Paeniglutamicibacter gangotriensis]EMQ98886.1 hypothetical protein ADIAG_01644 [Paeniglutamicibacter gangotriensis Lz1y]